MMPSDVPLQALGSDEQSNNVLVDGSMRTLWLSGFPIDVKHREIHNLFRPYRGYEDSILKPNGVAFVTFTSHEAAVAAKSDITVRRHTLARLFCGHTRQHTTFRFG
jgi:hypothetical protein